MSGIAAAIREFGDIPIDIQVELDRRFLRLHEVLELQEGSVVTLTKPAGEPLDVFVGGVLLGKGEALVLNETFGVRVMAYATEGKKRAGSLASENRNWDYIEPPTDWSLEPGISNALGQVFDESVCVAIVVGRTRLPLEKILRLSTGTFLELDSSLKQPVEVVVNNRLFALGETVVIEGNYGVRIQTLARQREPVGRASSPASLSAAF